jgi:hypothetical protein
MGKKNDKTKPVEPPAAQPDALIATPAPAPVAVPAPAAPIAAPAKAAAPIKTAVKKPVAKKPAPKKKKVASKAASITTEDISLRAYFISEHRHKHGLHGDSHSDWVEAERQLKSEARKAAAAKKKKK